YSIERRTAASTAKNSARVSLGLEVREVISPPIGQALADDALHRFPHALAVADAKADALVVPIVELGEVTLKVLLADVVIGADDPAFQDREIPFDRVGVPEAPAHIFLDGMVDGAVPAELATNGDVTAAFVGHQVRLAVNLSNQREAQILRGHVRQVLRANAPVTFD